MPELLTDAETAACPAAAREALARYLAGEISAEIALMHLLLATGALPALRQCLQDSPRTGRPALVRLSTLADRMAGAWPAPPRWSKPD